MCITVLWAVKAFLLESRGAVGVMFVLKAIFVGGGGEEAELCCTHVVL